MQPIDGIELDPENYLLSVLVSLFNRSEHLTMTRTRIWAGSHQQYMLLKVIPSQKFAIGIGDSFIFKYSIENNSLVELYNSSQFFMSINFISHAFDITNDYGMVVGFCVIPASTLVAVHAGFFISIHPLKATAFLDLDNIQIHLVNLAINYNRPNDMSIALSSKRNMAVIGIPVFDKIIILNFQVIGGVNISITRMRFASAPEAPSEFGRSIAWIDERTVALVSFSSSKQTWSKSEVRFYEVDTDFRQPLFIFPNNQQYVQMQQSPFFLHIVSWSGNLAILTDVTQVLVIPKAPPGFRSVFDFNSQYLISIFIPWLCSGGTYKNTTSLGPCLLCPSNTMNPGTQACTQCKPCRSDRFCPMGSISDLLTVNSYPSYTQTFLYPETQTMNNFDDLLLSYVLYFGNFNGCLARTPIFWIAIFVILTFLAALTLKISIRFGYQRFESIYAFFRRFFSGFNIIEEGNHWACGVFSVAIIFLSITACLFASVYLRLYPIEQPSSSAPLCDQTIQNSLFDSGLQLALPTTDGKVWPILTMLDEQQIILTVDLVNTQALCVFITFEQFIPGLNYIPIPILNCSKQRDNVTTSVSVVLPQKQTNLRMNVSGNLFFGGFRLCLQGPESRRDNQRLHHLDVCQFFYTPNQIVSTYASLSVELIKVVNQTQLLYDDKRSYFDGRWIPTFTDRLISDEIIYEKNGKYLLYTSQYRSLTMLFKEQPFFLQNSQQPIIRIGQLAFHTLLFCTLIIELFHLAFLVYKLISTPVRYFIRRRIDRIQPMTSSDQIPSTVISRRFYRQLRRMVLRGELHFIQRHSRKKRRSSENRVSI